MAHSRPMDEIDLLGKIFGRFVVVSTLQRRKSYRMWMCRCSCGVEKLVRQEHLLSSSTTSCGCRKHEPVLRVFESLYNRLLQSSKHPVELTYEEFLEFTKQHRCHYCGCEIVFDTRIVKQDRCNLDRKDSYKGYSKDNCVVCCKRCNIAKNNHFTYEEWVKIGNLIRSWNNAISKSRTA